MLLFFCLLVSPCKYRDHCYEMTNHMTAFKMLHVQIPLPHQSCCHFASTSPVYVVTSPSFLPSFLEFILSHLSCLSSFFQFPFPVASCLHFSLTLSFRLSLFLPSAVSFLLLSTCLLSFLFSFSHFLFLTLSYLLPS
jgi:hypothetical protein